MSGSKSIPPLVWAAAAAVMLLASLPQLHGWALAGSDEAHGWYSGLPAHNVPDNAVYLAWLRGAETGAVAERNFFTTRPQSGLKANVYYLVVGRLGAALGLSPVALFQATRLIFGLLLLAGLWLFAGLFAKTERARWLCWLCVCLSAGLGWLWDLAGLGSPSPTDLWQPEGFTFLSLFWSPQLVVPLLLIAGCVGALTLAERRRSYGWAAAAGACGLLLSNIHTYDLAPLGLGWALYLAARAARDGKPDAGRLKLAVCAALVAVPGVAYMAWVLRSDAVFAQRAGVLTVSPAPWAFALGYGGTLALAVWAATAGRRRVEAAPDAVLLLTCWAAGSFLAAYLPVPFQRKLVMGVHLPLALLAGLALDRLARTPQTAALALALLGLSNASFLAKDAGELGRARGPLRPYLTPGERRALAWLEANAAPGDAAQPLPWTAETRPGALEITDATLALFVPALTGLPVHCGHVGETPNYQETLYGWARLGLPGMPERMALSWLAESKVRWLVVSGPLGPREAFFARPPRWLRRVAEDFGGAAIFEFAPSAARPAAPRRARAA